MTIGALMILAAIAYGVHKAHAHRHQFDRLPKRPHRHDRVMFKKLEPLPPRRARGRRPAAPPMPLDENDLAELDGMFGDAGSRPEDYHR